MARSGGPLSHPLAQRADSSGMSACWRRTGGVLTRAGGVPTVRVQGGSSLEPSGDCGRHLFSASGLAGTWFGVSNITLPGAEGGCAYPRVNVTWSDGSLKHFSARERPHLVFGKDPADPEAGGDGGPLALTNAVIDSTDLPTYLFDKAYTLVQPINTKRTKPV